MGKYYIDLSDIPDSGTRGLVILALWSLLVIEVCILVAIIWP